MRYRVLFEIDSKMSKREVSQALLNSFLKERADLFVPSSCGELVYLAVEEVKSQVLFERARE
jgi:hypothetical protein